jgi:DNA-binding transcriptional regulator GbsR (MarR family)
MKIESISDWPNIDAELQRQIRSVNYNSDLYKMKRNIDAMVKELSKAEVEARRLKNFKYLQPKIDEINVAIDKMEKWIIMLLLAQ